MNFDEELKVLNNLFENNRLYGTLDQSHDEILPELIENKLLDLETRMLKSLYEQKKRNFELQQNIKNEKKLQHDLQMDIDKLNKTMHDKKEHIKQTTTQIVQLDHSPIDVNVCKKGQDIGNCRSKYGQFAEDYRLKLEKISKLKNKSRYQNKNETNF